MVNNEAFPFTNLFLIPRQSLMIRFCKSNFLSSRTYNIMAATRTSSSPARSGTINNKRKSHQTKQKNQKRKIGIRSSPELLAAHICYH